MTLEYPYFLLNYKVYAGTAGDDGIALAECIETVHERTGATFAVAPQIPDLSRFAAETSVPVVAQSVDALSEGRGTGRIALSTVATAGADGVIVNHPENRETLSEIERTIARCAEYELESIVCVDSVEMGRAVLAFDPDCLLFEEPTDIESGRSITRTHPERVERFVAAIEGANPSTRVLLGGGISTAGDVRRAFELGADAVGAASAFVEAADRRGWLTDIAGAMPDDCADHTEDRA